MVTPTFWLDTEFSNDTFFDYDLNVAVDLLKGSVSLLGIGLFDDCVLCNDFPVADLGNFGNFSETFSLGGFERISTNAFSLSGQPSSHNQSLNGTAPEPSTLLLFAAGLVWLGMRRRTA